MSANDVDAQWIAAERKHEREMAEIAARERYDRRHQLTERITAVAVGTTVVAVVAVVALLVWRLCATSAENNTRRDEACNQSGGTRTQIGTGPVVCLHLGPEDVGGG